MKNCTATAKEAMRTDFCRFSSQNSVGSAIELMQKAGARYLLVEERGEICGVTTPHEFAGYPLSRLVMDCPIKPVITISEETFMDEASAVLKTAEAAVLIVMNGKGETLGILDQECVITSLYQELKKTNEKKEKCATKRNEAENALRITKTFSDDLIDSMKDGFSVLSDHGVHLDVNPAFCRMTGFSKKELIGTGPPHLYWPPEEIEKIEESFKKALKGKSSDFELIFMRKNGERFPAILSPSQVKNKDGKVISSFATVKEITERKKREEALRKTTCDLEERNKELVALYSFSQLVVEPGITLEKILQRTVGLLPLACQYPDITQARIILADKEYGAIDFKSTEEIISSDIKVRGEKVGIMEIYHSEEQPEFDKKSFLKQEEVFLAVVAGRMGKVIECKNSEHELKEKKAFNRALFKNSPIQMIAVNAEGKVIVFNRAMKNSGHRLPKIGDIMYRDYAGKHSIDMYGQLMKCIKEKKVLEFPESKYGDKFLHITMSPLPDGGIITSHNITSRKNAENIIEQKRRTELVLYEMSNRFVGASGLITASNMDKAIDDTLADIGKFIIAARSYIFLFREDGVTLDNTYEWCARGVGSEINNRQNISSKTIPWWMEKLRKDRVILIEDVSKMPLVAETEKKIFQIKTINSLLALPLVKGKKIIGFIGFDNAQVAANQRGNSLFFLRISAELIEGALARVGAEQRLLKEKMKSEKLAEELKGAYENLKIIQKGLLKRAKIVTTGIIAAGVAHEIRNPLAIIGMTIQYLQSKLHEKDPKRELTEAIIKKVERLDRVTKELSNYGRTINLNLKKHSLKKCLDLNLALVKPKCRIQKIKIVKKYSKLPLVEMDDEQMDKAFLNIIDNAVQAMPRGGVLTVFTELGEDPDTVVIRMHNTGPVINKKHLKYIFEPFYTLKAKHMGTGLGLAISQSVVLRHLGEMYVENKSFGKDKGVAFVICLPLFHEKQKRNKL